MSVATASPSVIVRTKNESLRVRAALKSLRSQSVDVEIVLVDSGSTDDTVELAKPFCDEIVRIPPEEFTYGRSLNRGASTASGSILFALSAHCTANDPEWVRRNLQHYLCENVAGVFGTDRDPHGVALHAARQVTVDDVMVNPHWGFTNHASSWRRSAWEQVRFDESIRSCEDKQWMWRILETSLTVVVDPRLEVVTRHRRQDGIRALWRREIAEHRAVARWLDFPVSSPQEAVTRWWSSFPETGGRPPWQQRMSPWHVTELLAGCVGDRLGAAERDGATLRLTARELS